MGAAVRSRHGDLVNWDHAIGWRSRLAFNRYWEHHICIPLYYKGHKAEIRKVKAYIYSTRRSSGRIREDNTIDFALKTFLLLFLPIKILDF